MGAVVEIWFESLIPFLLKDSHIVHCYTFFYTFQVAAIDDFDGDDDHDD